jgi:hypothetical protein
LIDSTVVVVGHYKSCSETMSSQPQSKPEKKGLEKKVLEKKGKPKAVPKRNYQKAVNKNKPTEVETKKVYKIAIRELPSNNFNVVNFKDCLNTFIEALGLLPESIEFLHFMQGKLRYYLCSHKSLFPIFQLIICWCGVVANVVRYLVLAFCVLEMRNPSWRSVKPPQQSPPS